MSTSAFRINVPPNIIKDSRTTGFPVVHKFAFRLATFEDEEIAMDLAGTNTLKYKRTLFNRTLLESWKGKEGDPTCVKLRHHDGSSTAEYESWHPDLRQFFGQSWNRRHEMALNESIVDKRKMTSKGGKVVYTYTIPQAAQDEFKATKYPIVSTVGLRIQTAEDEITAIEGCGGNPLRYMRAITAATLVQVNGEPVGDVEEAIAAWHPMLRGAMPIIAKLAQVRAQVGANFFEENEEMVQIDE